MDCTVDGSGNLIYSFAPNGRQGIGVVQPQSGLDYPFTAPSDDIRYLIADLDVAVDDPGYYSAFPEFTPPFKVRYLAGVGCVNNTPPVPFFTPAGNHDADILVVDADNKTVFDSTAPETTLSTRAWGANYKLYAWRSPAGCCQLIAHTKWPENDDEKRHYNKYLAPANGVLDSRAVYVIPKRLKSIRVGEQDVKTTGSFTITNGYNTQTADNEPTTASFVHDTAVVISAVAGSGVGKYSNCAEQADPDEIPPAKAITRINGLSVITGDLLVGATDCLYLRRPTHRLGAFGTALTPDAVNHLQIGATCGPCCECGDYVNLGLKVNQYRSQYANIGVRVNDIKDIHEQNVQKWLDQRNCGLQFPLRLSMVPQRCPYMDIVAMVCNPCQDCSYVKELVLEITPANSFEASAELVAGYTALFSGAVNGRPIPISRQVVGNTTRFTIPFQIVRDSDSAYVRFRLKFSVAREYAILGALRATLLDDTPLLTGCEGDDNRQPAVAYVTQALYCDTQGNTTLP